MQDIEGKSPKQYRSQHKVGLVDAAPILGVSPYTLRTWVRQRKIPFYRCGRRIVFSQTDLDLFLEGCRVVPVEHALQ